MASSASEQDEPSPTLWLANWGGNVKWYFVPTITFRGISSGCTKVLFSKNIFRGSNEIFCDFSVRMELENEKIETHHLTFAYNWLPFRCSKINKYKDHFFKCSLCRIINPLLTKLVGSRWLDIGLVLIWRFYGPWPPLCPWKCKRRTWLISSHLDLALGQ